MLFLIGLYYSWPIILIFLIAFAVWAVIHNSRSPKVFEQRNYETLRRYQSKISELSSKANTPKTDIRVVLECAQKVADYYSELQSFCSQSKAGTEWFHSACDFPYSQSKKAVADYANLLAELQEFRSSFFPIVSPDENIQSDWAALSCDHDSREQLTRQKRSIKTVPVYIDRSCDTPTSFFLSNDMNAIYSVSLFYCTCPDHEKRGLPCKHMYRLFYELVVGTDYSAGIDVTNLDEAVGFLKLSDQDKASYIKTVRLLCGTRNYPLTMRKFPYIVKALQAGLLLPSDALDYSALLQERTKGAIIASLRSSGITDCYPSWTKVRLIDYVTKNYRQYLAEEYKDFVAVTIPPILEPWCKGFCSVIESRFTGDTDFLEEWDRRFDKFL